MHLVGFTIETYEHFYCETAAAFFVITPVYYESRTKYASTLRVIHSLSFVNCPWLQVKIRNGELDKTERSNDSKMYRDTSSNE